MKKFEIGKEYFTRSICDSECIFSIKITGRTAKTVSYEYMGESRRSKIRFDDSGEYIQPDRYSMAPTFRAEREVQPEEEAPAAEESAVSVPAEDAAPSNVITISQPADNGTVIVMIGQRVECVCGACYPVEGGTVIGFEDVPRRAVLPRRRVCPDSLGQPPGPSRTGPPLRHSPPRVAVCGWLSAGRVRGRVNQQGAAQAAAPSLTNGG